MPIYLTNTTLTQTISQSGTTAVVNVGTTAGLLNGTGAAAPAIAFSGSNDTLINYGAIRGLWGVTITGGNDTVTNASGGAITAQHFGIYGTTSGSTAATVVNAGSIAATVQSNGSAVQLLLGGNVTNLAGGVILASAEAIYLGAYGTSPGYVLNYGTLTATGTLYGAVGLNEGGSVVNKAGGVISSAAGAQYGVRIVGGVGTVTNAGTIDGGVILSSGNANRVIVDAGAVFSGTVNGGDATQAVLELAAGTGTFSASSGFTNFKSLTIDTGGDWLIQGGASLASEFGTISGFTTGDTIQLSGNETITGQSTGGGATHVTLTGATGMVLNFAGTLASLSGSYSGGVTNFTLGGAGPTLSTGGTVTFTGGGPAVTLDSTASVADSSNITGATVAITGGFVSGDQLNFLNTLGITGAFTAATGILTLSGTTSATNYQAALESISFSFSPSNGDPTNAGNHPSRTITWTVVDASGSTTGSSGVITQESSVLTYGQTIDETGLVAASETVNAGVMTLFNAGATAVGSIGVGTTVSTPYFTLGSDGSGGTDVIVNTVFGTYTSGVTLLTNPTTIAATGTAANAAVGGKAVSGPTGTTWTLVNNGLVSETAANGIGVSLVQAGTITNATGARITAKSKGIVLSGGGSVSNAAGGTIDGQNGAGITAAGAATVVNAGLLEGSGSGFGISLTAGGAVTNQSGGTISGRDGVAAANTAVTVVNAGRIAGATYSGYAAISLAAGGTVTNQAGGTVTGYSGVVSGSAATVVNAGSIGGVFSSGSHGSGVSLGAGGLVTNASGATIIGATGVLIAGAAGTVQNAGSIGGTTAAGVQLNAGGSVTNASGGAITGASGVLGSSLPATVVNAGSIAGDPTAANVGGVILFAGGTVTNQTGGQITGHYGVAANGALTLVNAGSIGGDATNASGGAGFYAGAGGAVTNQAGGTIIGFHAVWAGGAVLAVDNAGSIGGTTSLSSIGVELDAGGTVTNSGTISGGADAVILGAGSANRLIVAADGTFIGTVDGGNTIGAGSVSTLELTSSGATGTISGLGSQFVNFAQITVDSGASWALAGSNSIVSGVTLTNAGTDSVTGTLVNAGLVTGTTRGLFIGSGGLISNQSGGIVSATATSGVAVAGGGGTVVNAATLQGNTATGMGVSLASGGSVTNQSGGTISGSRAVFAQSGALTVVNAGSISGGTGLGQSGVVLNGGGTVSNQAGGYIGGHYAVAVYTTLAALTNAGSIGGAYSVLFNAAGSLTNVTGGTISGSAVGIFANAAVTVANAGGITGGTYGIVLDHGGTIANQTGATISSGGTAVSFGAGYTGRLIVQPGATFVGRVDGGNAIGGTSITALELASAAGAGTLSGFGSQFVDFGQVTFDAGAQWSLAGLDGTAALGGATISGFTYGDTIDVTNLAATASAFSGNHLTLTSGASSATLDIQGNFITQQFSIASDGSGGTDIILQSPTLHYGDTLAEAGIVATSETVAAGTMTLFNSGSTAVGTIGVGTSVSTGDFLVSNDGTNTQVVLDTVFGTYTSGITLLTNPTTIGSSAAVSNSGTSAVAVAGLTGTAWTLTNLGSVSGSGVYSAGISLASGGTIINASGGIVSDSAAYAIRVTGTTAITNQSGGTIEGSSGVLAMSSGVDVVNSGLISGSSRGVTFKSGGTIDNQSGGTIESAAFAVVVLSGVGAVTNAGIIAGSGGAGMYLDGGGQVSNQAGGTISGLFGVEAVAAPITVANAGSIGAASAIAGIRLAAGGTVTNLSGGVISGRYAVSAGSAGATVINAGTLAGYPGGGAGVRLTVGGSVSNQPGGAITGYNGVLAAGGPATVSNAGYIGGSHGISLGAGGLVTNAPGATITGATGVFIGGAAGTVQNAGTVLGTVGAGIAIAAGGTITNQSGGAITGSTAAVTFASGFANRLAIDPGAAFTGVVDGGNTIGGASISTLELASAAAAGTLSGLGVQFVNFAQATIDADANWTVAGNSTLVAGATLANAGTFTDAGTLFNAGTLTGNALRLNNGSFTNQADGLVTGSYVYGVAGGTGDVLNQGTITGSSGSAIYLAGTGNVSNAAGALISGAYGIKLKGGSATLANQGQITATSGNPSAYAAYLRNGGLVINGQGNGSATSTAAIQGYSGVVLKSVDTVNQLGTVLNYGTITGTDSTASAGAALQQGGSVINGGSGATAALIQGGRDGVYDAGGSVTNYGTILAGNTAAPGVGVSIGSDGTVSNLGASALIEGYVGVAIQANGTVVNNGTIASGLGIVGTAVSFTGGNARLIEAPTATLIGGVYGGTGGTAVLELASGASAGIITGFGTSIVNLTSLVFDTGSQWTVAGNDSANGLGTLGIGGFTYGDTIDLTNFSAVSRSFASNTLVLTDGGGAHETLHITGSFVTNQFLLNSDGAGGTDVHVRQIPSITAGDTVSFIGGGSAVALDPGLTVTDAASTTLTSASVWIGSGFLSGDVLNFVNTGSITGSYDSATGTLTLGGTATVADYQAALESITYSFTPGNGDPTGGGGNTSRTIDWLATDGVAISQTETSTVNLVHVAPGVTASGTVDFASDGSAVALDPGIVLSGPDSFGLLTGATVAIGSGFLSGDVLNFVNTGGITGSYNAATGTLTLSGTAGVANYQSALASITYSFTGSDPSGGATDPTRSITWLVTDGSSSNGISNTGTTGLNVYGPPPVIGNTTSVTATYIQQGASVVLDGAITLADGDSTTLSAATVTISGGFLSGDTLTAVTAGTAITALYNNGTLALSGVDTLANYQQVLRSITYGSSAADPTNGGSDVTRTITWQIDDGRGGNNLSNIGTTTIDDHVRPVVTAGNTVTFGVGGGAILVAPTLGVADADTNPILTGTVAITGGLLAGDVLAFNNGSNTESFLDGATLSASYSGGALTFSESGSQASAADWQQALRSVTFNNAGADPTSGGTDLARTLTWTLNTVNLAQTSVAVGSTVDVAPPPVIAGTVSGQATTDEAASSPFSGVTITDANIGQTETVTLVLSDAANGTLSNLGGGMFNNGTYVVTGSALGVTSAIDALVFTPTAHEVAPGETVTTGFSMTVTDSVGATSSDSTTSVVATAVNDPPTILQVVSPIGDPNQEPANPFAVLTVQDPDVGHNSDVLTVTLSNPAGGTLSNLSGGSYDSTTGVYSVTGSAAQLTAALAALVFTPAAPPAGSFTATTQFTVAVAGPGGSATNDRISVTAVTQNVPGVPGGATTSTISVSPDGSSFAPPTAGQTNEAIISQPAAGGSYTIPTGYQAAYLGGSNDATLNDDSVNDAVLVGNSGNDTISAGADRVTLTGGAGNNTFLASGTSDVIGVTGTATVGTSGSQDVVYAGSAGLVLNDTGTHNAIGLSSGSAALDLSGSGASVFGGTGSVTVNDTGNGDVIGAAAGPVSATLGGSETTVYGGSGALTLNVTNTATHVAIGTGMGDASLTVGGGATTVYGGGGALTADVTGNDAAIGLGSGPASLTVTGSNTRIYGGSGDLSVLDLGSNNTIGAGVGSTTVSGGGSGAMVVGSSGALEFIGGAGDATVIGGSGSTTVIGGSGATTLYGTSGSVMTDTGGPGAITYQAGQGNETLQASGNTAGAVINGGIDSSGHDVLIGGSGNDSIFAGTGAETLTGGAGSNEFVFYKSVIAGHAPSDIITDFNSNDSVYLAGYGSSAAASALQSASAGSGGVTITLSDSTRITFTNVSAAVQLAGHVVSF